MVRLFESECVQHARDAGIREEAVCPGRAVHVRTQHLRLRTADGEPIVLTRKTRAEVERAAPVVLVHGFAQNRFGWHLQSISFANALAAAGFDVFIAELRGHGLSGEAGSTHARSFSDYVDLDVPAIIDGVRVAAGGARPLLVGHSLGGVIACGLDARVERELAGIVAMAAPVFLGRGNKTIRILSTALLGAHDLLFGRKLPRNPSRFSFRLAPFARMYRTRLGDPRKVRFPFAIWEPGGMDPDASAELLARGFDRTGFEVLKTLVLWAGSGRFTDTDREAGYERRLAEKTVPMLFVGGDADRLAPPPSILPGFELAGSKDKTLRLFGGGAEGCSFGHYDLVLGKKAPDLVWPHVIRWMKDRAD